MLVSVWMCVLEIFKRRDKGIMDKSLTFEEMMNIAQSIDDFGGSGLDSLNDVVIDHRGRVEFETWGLKDPDGADPGSSTSTAAMDISDETDTDDEADDASGAAIAGDAKAAVGTSPEALDAKDGEEIETGGKRRRMRSSKCASICGGVWSSQDDAARVWRRRFRSRGRFGGDGGDGGSRRGICVGACDRILAVGGNGHVGIE